MSSTDEGKVLWIRIEDSKSVVLQGNVAEDMILRNNTISQSNNIDLSETPNLRSLFADLKNPDSIFDLIIAGKGYQVASSLPSGTPASVAPTIPLSDVAIAPVPQTADVSSSAGAVAAQPAPSIALALPPMPFHMAYDHFTALP
jgi:hypothetical protein